ncbi:unnamed protein product, partial [Rhizoctonia solani]
NNAQPTSNYPALRRHSKRIFIVISMSSLCENTNNLGVLLEAPNEISPYQHDPKYYYPDGSATVLIGDVLFKFQLSLLIAPYEANNTFTGDPTLRDQLLSSCDSNPVRLKECTPEQFRNFLSVVLGLPSDPGYLALLTGARDPKNHNGDLLIQYLDIASFSQRFGMTRLEKWARRQLQLVLRSSHKFTESEWNEDTLHRLHSYAYSRSDESIRAPVVSFIQYFISVSTDRHQSPRPPLSNFTTCIELYKDNTLKQRDPALFGCVFAAVVSQRHQEWTSILAQQDRALLYVAQVQLTSLATVLQNLYWLRTPASELPFLTGICSACQAALPRLWGNTFGRCRSLNSRVLLHNISSLARLPQYFHSLSQIWAKVDCIGLPDPDTRNHRQPSATGFNGSLRILTSLLEGISDQTEASGRPYRSQKCYTHCLPQVSALIDEVYNELAVQHTRFVTKYGV